MLRLHSSGIQPEKIEIYTRRLFSLRVRNSPLMWRRFSFALLLMSGLMPAGVANAAPDLTQMAQAQDAQTPAAPATQAPSPPAPDPAAPAADAAPEEPIGNVATVTGKATVKRDDKTIPLKVKDDIYLNDVVQTAANSALGITFSDGTTFNLKANAQITVDTFVYEDGGKQNAGVFDVAKGTVAFVAAAVAKTGDMKIATPTATLGIRGTSGLVEVPEGASATSKSNVNVKLYPDADGRVGRIEVNDRAGAQLGFLTQGSSGFAIRPGTGGMRFAAVPISITPQMIARDQGFVRQVHSMQLVGRRVFDEQRAFRRANPTFVNPNRPIRQPGQFRQNGQPGQPGGPQRQNGLPGQNRPGQQQPGLQNRPGQQPPGGPGRQGQQQRPGQPGQTAPPNQTGPRSLPGQPGQPALPSLPSRQGQQQPGLQQPGLPPRPGQPQQTGAPPQPGQPGSLPRPGQPRETGLPPQPGQPGSPASPAGPGQPRLSQPPGQPPSQLPGRLQNQPPAPQQGGGQFRQGGVPGAPGVQRPGPSGRPALQLPRRPAPAVVPAPRDKKRRDVR
jgi:hypothetical protein